MTSFSKKFTISHVRHLFQKILLLVTCVTNTNFFTKHFAIGHVFDIYQIFLQNILQLVTYLYVGYVAIGYVCDIYQNFCQKIFSWLRV